MTSREFSEVDHDLLADYVGGALDGTPEQASVARLIEEDRAWGDAYAALARAMDLVHADLADWAAAPAPTLPVAVTDRITAALADAGPAPTDGNQPVGSPLAALDGVSGELPPARRPVTAVPAQPAGRRAGGAPRPAEGPGRGTGPGRRSRRWVRIAGPVALAAASITAVGFGFSSLIDAGRGDTAVPAAGSGMDAAAPEGAAPFRTTGPPLHSGTDYSREQLSGGSLPFTVAGEGWAASGAASQRALAADGLDRLTQPDALQSCLRAIGAEHAATPLTVELIDYASFQGRPALVVTFLDAGGERWAWVSGPECGVSGSDADTRFRTRVG